MTIDANMAELQRHTTRRLVGPAVVDVREREL